LFYVCVISSEELVILFYVCVISSEELVILFYVCVVSSEEFGLSIYVRISSSEDIGFSIPVPVGSSEENLSCVSGSVVCRDTDIVILFGILPWILEGHKVGLARLEAT